MCADLAEAACRALEERRVPCGCIRVTAQRGWVTLEGKVEWLYQRNEASEAVRALPGVAGCYNHISVAPR